MNSVKLNRVSESKQEEGDMFLVAAMCLDCENRWLGGVPDNTNLFELECPNCRRQNSFASFLPSDFFGNEEESDTVH